LDEASEPAALAESEEEAEPSEPAAFVERKPFPEQTTTFETTIPAAGVPGQPVVLRIELAIVNGSPQLRVVDTAPPPAPPPGPLSRAASGTEDDQFTPHTNFESQSHGNGNGNGQATVPELESRVSVGTPSSAASTAPSADRPADATSQVDANPTSTWKLESAPQDPLATLPAAPVTADRTSVSGDERLSSLQFAVANAAVAAGSSQPVVQSNSEQPDLWFLSSEPKPLAVDNLGAGKASEPSSVMTAGMTVLMGAVVIGLVVAFLWLMTSLPILR
jgi:hypothetical protein